MKYKFQTRRIRRQWWLHKSQRDQSENKKKIYKQLKFAFFEKATKYDKISILLLTNKFVLFVSRYSFEHQSGS